MEIAFRLSVLAGNEHCFVIVRLPEQLLMPKECLRTPIKLEENKEYHSFNPYLSHVIPDARYLIKL